MLRPKVVSPPPGMPASQPYQDDTKYTLKLGDEIEVKFYYQSDLNQIQAIRPDGKISLQLIGEIQAAGLTAQDLAEKIVWKYHRILRRPEATVIINRIVPAKIFVGGRVSHPGVMEVDSTLTALQAIFQAGGFLDSAEMREILLIRRTSNYEQPMVYMLDLEKPTNDVLLHPYDIVYVPPSSISQVNSFIEQYIERLLPFSMSVDYNLNGVRNY